MQSGGKRPVMPAAAEPTPSPTPTSEDVVNSRTNEQQRIKRLKGRSSTILTDGDLGTVDIKKKSLLG